MRLHRPTPAGRRLVAAAFVSLLFAPVAHADEHAAEASDAPADAGFAFDLDGAVEVTEPSAEQGEPCTPPAGDRPPRLHVNDVGMGYHGTLFRTEVGGAYALHGPSAVYTYFVGRRWGFMLRGEAYFPFFGRMDGPNGGGYRGEVRTLYETRRFGFDATFMVARRVPITDRVIVTAGFGAHVQSFALTGSVYLPVEAITFGIGGLGKLEWLATGWLSFSAQLAGGFDFLDLVHHENRVTLAMPLSGVLSVAARR